jgi:gluconate 5-dehydrogenase
LRILYKKKAVEKKEEKMKDHLSKIFNVSNKRILITGASGFLGRYFSRSFLEVGAKVILLDRSSRILEQTKDYQREFGRNRVVSFQIDFYKRKELEKQLKKIAREFEIDVLINNAYDLSGKTGFNTPLGNLDNLTYEQWKAAFESGIYWAVLTTQIIGTQFKKKKQGNIINISSMYGIVAPDPKLYLETRFLNPATYGVNKAGLIALTRYTASFWGQYGIRCNAIVPGSFSNIETKSANSLSSGDPFIERLKIKTALNRIGHPSELIGALIFLASDASNYMTGQSIIIDGGWTVI